MNIESSFHISTSWKSLPLTPSTLMRKLESGFLRRIEEMTIPFFARFATISRAVGVPRSVKTVSKLTVSREKVSMSLGDVETASLIQEMAVKPIHHMIVIKNKKAFFIIY